MTRASTQKSGETLVEVAVHHPVTAFAPPSSHPA
jgi:hypothetical protein